MDQSLDQVVCTTICNAELRQEVESIPLLRGASAIPPADPWDASPSVRLGQGLRVVFVVKGLAQPTVQDLIPHREQGSVSSGMPEVGEARQDPVRSPPFRIRIALRRQISSRVTTSQEGADPRRPTDRPFEAADGRRGWIFAEDEDSGFPSDGRILGA